MAMESVNTGSMRTLSALFGAGLVVSGMTDPAQVRGFLRLRCA